MTDFVLNKRKEKIVFIGMVILVILVFLYLQNTNSLFNFAIEQVSGVNWDQVIERNIVKNAIPITLLEKQNGKCLVDAHKFDYIIDHQYFIRSGDLIRDLNYDRGNETLEISCELLVGDKSRLDVWYVVEESEKHPTKYEFFVTEWIDDT